MATSEEEVGALAVLFDVKDQKTKAALTDFVAEWNDMNAAADAADAEFDRLKKAQQRP